MKTAELITHRINCGLIENHGLVLSEPQLSFIEAILKQEILPIPASQRDTEPTEEGKGAEEMEQDFKSFQEVLLMYQVKNRVCFTSNDIHTIWDAITYYTSLPAKSVTDEPSDTHKCKECGGRTALITGSFYYEPDAEPYENGIEEEAKTGTGECWAGGYKCDDCGNIQGLWHE